METKAILQAALINSDFFQYTELFSVITETSTALSSADLVETSIFG